MTYREISIARRQLEKGQLIQKKTEKKFMYQLKALWISRMFYDRQFKETGSIDNFFIPWRKPKIKIHIWKKKSFIYQAFHFAKEFRERIIKKSKRNPQIIKFGSETVLGLKHFSGKNINLFSRRWLTFNSMLTMFRLVV